MSRAGLGILEVGASPVIDSSGERSSAAGGSGDSSALNNRPSWTAPLSGSRSWSSFVPEASAILDEFTDLWDRGEAPRIADFLNRIAPESSDLAIELIYRQFCLEEADGSAPSPESYLDRFAEHREALGRLFRLHTAVTGSQLRRWTRPEGDEDPDDPFADDPELPRAGDQIGPFALRRELGQGTFARVFLAEQTDLENRHVVVKVSSRPSREPWLLARARHPHIVEIIAQFEVDGGSLQLISMPFFGGATLASVLGRIRDRPSRPTSGSEFLNDLDATAAPEYPEGQRGRASRNLVADSTYEQALAWMAARLAEALDFASTRKVVHGDIKPSNILISADATPMLLDFNLAQDWALGDNDLGPADRGGTLAYMAPERLEALSIPSIAPPRAHDPHRADLYSLGMVLLEALSARGLPHLDELRPEQTNRKAVANFRESAARLAGLRTRTSPRDLIRQSARVRSPALRAILERCLDPDPDQRYPRGETLADDLDRWRTGRALAFASEPRFHTAYRCLARRKFSLIAAAAVLLSTVATGYGVSCLLNAQTLETLRRMGIEKLANWWDAPETRTFGFPRIQIAADRLVPVAPAGGLSEGNDSGTSFFGKPRIRPEVESKAMENATLALRDYQVLEETDWRTREDVRNLPQPEREDLELWLMEQAYRYCQDLANRPDSPDDWERALAALDRLGAIEPLTAFSRLRDRVVLAIEGLERRQPEAPGGDTNAARPASSTWETDTPALSWLDEFVLGVALECEADNPASSLAETLDSQAGSLDERALAHYRTMLSQRPETFWGHYRTAVVCQRLGLTRDTSEHLSECLRRRPANPAIHGQLASSLFMQKRLDEALTVCDRAIALDPDRAEYHRTRAFIDADLGRSEEIRGDLHRFEVLSRALPATLLRTHFRPDRGPTSEQPPGLHLVDDSSRTGSRPTHLGDIRISDRNRSAIAPQDLDTRFNLARAVFLKTKNFEQGIAELDKILILDPNYLHARIFRASHLVETGSLEEGRRELGRVLKNPRLADFLLDYPDTVTRFVDIAWRYMKHGKHDDALDLARKSLDFAESVRKHLAISHYTVARATALTARRDRPALIAETADHLTQAFFLTETIGGAPSRYRQWYIQDPSFRAIRGPLDAALKKAASNTPIASPLRTALNRSRSQTGQ